MTDEQRMGDAGALVVSGDDAHRDPLIGHRRERGKGPLDEPGRHAAAEEDVAAVHDEVALALSGRGERALEAGEELGAPPTASHTGPARLVQAEVGVGEEEDPHPAGDQRHRRASPRALRSRSVAGPRRRHWRPPRR